LFRKITCKDRCNSIHVKNPIASFPPISILKECKTLSVDLLEVNEFDFDKDFPLFATNIERFELINAANLSHIEKLTKLTKLKELIFTDCADLGPSLPHCPRLTQIECFRFDLMEDFDANLPEAEQLIPFLSSMANLREVHITVFRPDLWEIMEEKVELLSMVEKLDLKGNDIALNSSSRWPQSLQSLHLSYNCVMEIESLKSLKHLVELRLDNNEIVDIGHLSSLNQLQSLNLSSNNVSDIEVLGTLTELKTLNVSDNFVENIKPLSSLQNLEHLYLAQNQISNIRSLRNLKNLNHLDLDHNKIRDIGILRELHCSLKHLTFSWNPINDLKHSGKLSQLQYL